MGAKKTGLTDFQIRALRVLADNGPMSPRQFAEKIWPDAQAWERVSNVGNGATRGVGITRAGGCYLARMRSRGWARPARVPGETEITEMGEILLGPAPGEAL